MMQDLGGSKGVDLRKVAVMFQQVAIEAIYLGWCNMILPLLLSLLTLLLRLLQ